MTFRPDRLLSLDEIAHAIDRAVSTVRWLRSNGRGPETFIHRGRVVARESAVRDWLIAEERRTTRGGIR